MAIGLGIISGILVVVGAIYYVSVIVQNSDTQNGTAFALLILLRTTPFPWDELLLRARDTVSSLTGGWLTLVTIGALAGLLWNQRRDRTANGLFGLLILIGAANLFVLSIWPKLYIGASSLTFLGVLFAAFVVRLQSRWRWLWPACVLAIVAVAIVGLVNLAQYATGSREDYRQSRLGQDAAQVDAWLAGQGLQDTEIHTFCAPLISYSQNYFHLIYRLAIRDIYSADWYNSPNQLLPILREQHQLFMRCGEVNIPYKDWDTFLGEPGVMERMFREIGRVDNYIFYEVK